MSVADPIFPIPDPGSRLDKIPDPNPRLFLNQKTDTKFSKIRSVMLIPDSGTWIWILFHPGSGSRIQESNGTRSRIRICNTAKYLVQIRKEKL
jgi:hypothetical protein